MQHFIPFADDWDALANLRPEDLVPYRAGMLRDVRINAATVFPIHRKPTCELRMKALPASNG